MLLIAWDDLGFATMDIHGGPVECPNMRRIAERELSSGFPGISTRIPFESGFESEVLAEHGYNTSCIGKWHLTPGEECNLAAYKGRWPLGRGFERFDGYLGGEANSWYPDLVHDNHQIEAPGRPEDGYHLADDLAETAVSFVQDAKVIDPDEPFFMHFAPGAGHAPHLVPTERADKYRGKFDLGYEAIRTGILARQLIIVVSDNGGSGEGGPNGTFDEWEFFNRSPSTTERTLPHLDELGTPASNNHYGTGWAWALDTPFPYWKRWAGYEGGCATSTATRSTWSRRSTGRPGPDRHAARLLLPHRRPHRQPRSWSRRASATAASRELTPSLR